MSWAQRPPCCWLTAADAGGLSPRLRATRGEIMLFLRTIGKVKYEEASSMALFTRFRSAFWGPALIKIAAFFCHSHAVYGEHDDEHSASKRQHLRPISVRRHDDARALLRV